MCGCRKLAGGGGGAPGGAPGGGLGGGAARLAQRTAARPAAPPPPSKPVIDTSVWGPPLWRALHIAAVFSDRMTVRHEWPALIQYLLRSLPCPDCTRHYRAWVASHRFIRGNNAPDIRKQAHEWLVALHNDVNVRTGKPTMTPDAVATLFGGDRKTRIAEAEAAVASLQKIVGASALRTLSKILVLIK